jgi:hypothetical protein
MESDSFVIDRRTPQKVGAVPYIAKKLKLPRTGLEPCTGLYQDDSLRESFNWLTILRQRESADGWV